VLGVHSRALAQAKVTLDRACADTAAAYASFVGDRTSPSVGVRLTIVANEGEAEVVCSILRSEGIRCGYRTTDVSAESGLNFGGWREVLVDAADESQARELLAAIK